jgi:hypothetical protein
MEIEVLLDNEFFTIERFTGQYGDGTPYKEIRLQQYQSPEKTCEELVRLYKLDKACKNMH